VLGHFPVHGRVEPFRRSNSAPSGQQKNST
jgi:hypothetical protein